MTVIWNKVTWYSKLIALVLFVALPFVGFWLGTQYGEIIAPLAAGISSGTATSTVTSDYYTDIAEWQTDTRPDGGFSIAYPLDFSVDDNYSVAPTTDWRLDATSNEPGLKLLTITIPSAFEPQTNFADATLTVGKSANDAAIADCLTPGASANPGSSMATTTINGIVFSVFESSGIGAGNLYETTSYRTLHAGACYAVEYTIHSSQIENYPAAYNLRSFDEAAVISVFDRMVGTFQFQ